VSRQMHPPLKLKTGANFSSQNRLEELTRYTEAAALLRYHPLISRRIHLM